jgi:hypothetical protein
MKHSAHMTLQRIQYLVQKGVSIYLLAGRSQLSYPQASLCTRLGIIWTSLADEKQSTA